MKARMLCTAYRTYTVAQGCPLKRFLHVPQEAAGGSKRGGSKLVLSGNTLPSFFSCSLRLHQLKLPVDPVKSVIATYLNQDLHLFLKYFSKLLQFWSEEK